MNQISALEREVGEIPRTVKFTLSKEGFLLFDLMPQAEDVHDESYDILKNLVPGMVPKTRVYISNINSLGKLLTHYQTQEFVIGVDRKIGELNPLNRTSIEFTQFFSGQKATVEDFLRYVITHEYGHIFHDHKLKTNTELFIPRMDPKVYHAESEAFAFWFGETFTEFVGFGLKLLDGYKEKFDINHAKSLYHKFREESYNKGPGFVLKNYLNIAGI